MRIPHALCLCWALLLCGPTLGQEAAGAPEVVEQNRDKAGLEKAMKKFQEVWNAGDARKILASLHPSSPMLKGLENEAKRARVEVETKEVVEMFGRIEKFEIRKFIESKSRYVIRVEFSKKGILAGTYAAQKLENGEWCLSYMNVDGQGEPELKE